MRELPGPNSPAAVGWGRQGSALALHAPVPALGRGRGGTGSGDCPQCLWAACLQDRAGLGILGIPIFRPEPSAQSPPRWGRPLHPGHLEEGWKVTPSFRGILYKGADLLPRFWHPLPPPLGFVHLAQAPATASRALDPSSLDGSALG